MRQLCEPNSTYRWGSRSVDTQAGSGVWGRRVCREVAYVESVGSSSITSRGASHPLGGETEAPPSTFSISMEVTNEV